MRPVAMTSRDSRRHLGLAVRAGVLVALVAGTLGFARTGSPARTVTVSADGTHHVVRLYGGDVAVALQRAGVAVGSHDVVAPALSDPVHDGSHVVVARGRPLTLTLDGSHRKVWVTEASLADAADALGLRLDGAYVSANRSRTIPLAGLALTVRMPQQVSLVVGGLARSVTTTEPSVAALLTDAGVELGQWDTVSVPLDTYPTSATTVTVTQVTHAQKLERTPLAIPTRRVKDHHLTVGTIELSHGGRAGTRSRLWGIVTTDGTVTTRKLLQQRVVNSTPKVLLVGSRPKATPEEVTVSPPTPAPTVHHASPTSTRSPQTSVPTTHQGSGLDWPALARCESGGDPRSVDGSYYGLYQFSLGTWEAVGGRGRPSDASAAEQTYRAQLLYAQQGRSPWPSCGHLL